jgi:hypothetical protein
MKLSEFTVSFSVFTTNQLGSTCQLVSTRGHSKQVMRHRANCSNPIKWARRWLMEFRDDPDGVLFADHWRRQYETVKGALEQNPSDPQHDSTHFCFSTLVPSTLTSRR